ncbi:hypothetical protein EON65_56235, partial [archaeon]
MSGSKRQSQYRKGVANQYLQGKAGNGSEDVDIVVTDTFARITSNQGGNLFAAELADGRKLQAKLPNKFHKMIWVRPGDLVVLDHVQEEAEALGGEIRNILSKDLIKQLSRENVLPDQFKVDQGQGKRGYDMDDLLPPRSDEEGDEG